MSAPPFGSWPPDPSKIPAIPSPAGLRAAMDMKIVSITLNVLCFLLFAGRMWTRNFPVSRMGPDDYVILVSYILIVLDTALLLLTMPHMFGKPPSEMTFQDSINAQRYAFFSQPLWACAMAGIKISIVLMILRLQIERLWRRFCWGLIGFVIVFTIYNVIAQLTQCIPIRKTWDVFGLVPGKCWSAAAIRGNLSGVAVINFTTDFIIALLPITFLARMQRPLRERIIIGILMGLGIFAGVCSIVKMMCASNFGKTGDLGLDGIRVGMWSVIEETVGFIAACVPCLRSPFQKFLTYCGFISTRRKTSFQRGYGHLYVESSAKEVQSGSSKPQSAAMKLKSLRSTEAASEENILASGMGSKTNEIWCTTEVEIGEEARTDTPKSPHDLEAAMNRH